MTTFSNYKKYRQLELRNAWILAGMDKVLLPFLRGAFAACLMILAYGVVSHKVEASQNESTRRVDAATTSQAAYIKSLETLLAKCLSGGDHPITVGDEIWFCGATSIGIKK